jgi:hypothetical protein
MHEDEQLHQLAREAETAATPLEQAIVCAKLTALGVRATVWPEHLGRPDY